MLYPWQKETWKQLWQWRVTDRFPHALLLSAQEGMGKYDFAMTLSQSLLCQYATEDNPFCGKCEDCQLIKGQSHPNFHSLVLEEKEKTLSVDKVREVLSFVQIKAVGARVVLIYPAEAMNVSAANALLKSLEEPNEGVYFILITHRAIQLPATIKSRCAHLQLPHEKDNAISWLQEEGMAQKAEGALTMAEGAPLLAKKLAESPFADSRQTFLEEIVALLQQKKSPVLLAEEWKDKIQKEHLFSLATFFVDIARYSVTKNPALVSNNDFEHNIKNLSSQVSLNNMMGLSEKTLKTYELFLSKTNTNLQLLLEDLFVSLSQAFEEAKNH